MPDQCRRDAALNRFWNELLQPVDGAGAAASDLASDQADTLRRIHAMTQTPLPAGARARVDDAMRVHFAAHQNGKDAATMSQTQALAIRPPGIDSRRWTPSPATPTGWRWMGQFATAMLLLVTVGLGYIVFGPGRPDVDRPALPALLAPATIAPADDALVSVTLPAGALPEAIVGGLNHYTIPAGSRSNWLWTCCTGARLDYVLSGSYTVRGEGPMQVHRHGGGGWEEAAVGSEVVLEAGDALLSRMEHPYEAVNAGAEPAEILDVVLLAGEPGDDPIPQEPSGRPAWRYHDQDIHLTPVTVPAAPMTVRIGSAVLAAGATLPPPPGAILQLAISLNEDNVAITQPDFAVENLGPDVDLYVLTLASAASAASAASTPQADNQNETSLHTLLATTLPAALAPTAGNLDYVLWHAVLDPGQQATFAAAEVDCCPGPQVTHLVSGELALQVDGPVQVFRGDGIATGVAGAAAAEAGSEIVLRPGDTVIYDFARPAEYTNLGADPAHIVGGGLLAGSMSWTPAGMTVLDGNEEYSAPALPPGPVEVTLVRAELPPEGIVPAPPADSLVLEVGAFGDASVAQGGDGRLRNIGDEATTIYVLTVIPAGTGPSA